MNSPQAIICRNPERLADAESLAQKFKLPLFSQGQSFSGLCIVVGERIQLHDPALGSPLQIDLAAPTLLSRLQSGKKQPLGRACGLHRLKQQRILDCTAGSGQDMLTLAALGAQVTALERNPYIHLLLDDALKQSDLPTVVQAAVANCAPLENEEAGTFLQRPQEQDWDVIYLDPMFSGYKRKALPKKSMQMFADICGPDDDAPELLALALQKARRRVVVKRGVQAPLLSGQRTPDLQIKGNRMRFDIYLAANQRSEAA